MKKLTILAALCALLLGSCAENNLDGVTPETAITLPDLTAGFAEDDTKTYVENGKYLRWHEADLITAFFGNTLNRQYKFKGKTGDNSGTFKLVPDGELGTGNSLNAIYAIYPYDESTTITDEGAMTINLPAVQNYAENSFGKGANTMMAVTAGVEDTFLGFKNACGYLKLKLYGEDATLASVEVRGNNGEKIAGSATATMEFGGVPTLAMNNDATTSVTLDCGEGVVLGATAETATELWIVLPETTFENGITITATDVNGITFEKSTSNTITIVRNEIQPMAALEAEFTPAGPADNEIWYTATEKVTPYDANVFGANIVSNEWNETTGEGVITFDGEVTSIGSDAFSRCKSLTSVTIPDSVTSIGEDAFFYCLSLASVTIGNSVTSIGEYAFYYCKGLASITIPDSVTSIGVSAFGSSGLESITIPDGVTSIGAYTFSGCSGLASITIPDSVTSIGNYAFSFCKGLASITIPDSVTSIGNYAFEGCSSLTNITIPESVTSIGSNAFEGCSGLESITIPESVTSIGDQAFYGCSSLASITIPDSVTSIGWYAFYGCSSLAEVYCKPTTPPTGDYSMFDNNANGRKIYVPTESVNAYKAAEYWSSNYRRDIVGYDFEKGEVVIPTKPANDEIWYTATEKVTPDNVKFGANIVSNEWDETTGKGIIIFDGEITMIGEWAFGYCSSLSSITIPDSVTSIGWDAFYGCSSLASITIPDSVTSIGYEAFYNCSSLVSITIPDRVTRIGYEAFYNCSSLASVTIGNSVTWIDDYAFQSCSSLTSITIPDSVTSIGNYAFRDCSSLASVTIGNSVTSIGRYAFYGCSSLAEFKGKLVSEDGRCLIINGVLNSFAPTGLTEYTIPDSVTSIGNYAFSFCKGLASITIPDSVTSIGNYAFEYCSSLSSITIPDSVTKIGSDAFTHCLSLTSATIGNGVTSIGLGAFYNCSSLESVTIGNGVTSIIGYAFYYCSKLLNIYCKALTPPAIYYGSYSNTFPSNSGMKIYVPRESLAAYKQYSSGQSDSASVQNWYYYESYLVGYDF